MPSIYLPNKCFVMVSGSASKSFLQRLITADINNLPLGIARCSTFLSPQGKILFYFLISKLDENVFVLEIDNSQCNLLVEKFLSYKLRTDVVFEVQKTNGTTIYWDQDDNSQNNPLIDERFSIAGLLLHRIQGHSNNKPTYNAQAYHELKIDYGIVNPIVDFPLSTVFPHDIFMDLIQGISFTKGCYIGQEVVSRMQHRGTIRKRSIIIMGKNDLPLTASSILVNNIKIGIIGNIIGRKALAIVHIDKVSYAIEKNIPLTVDGINVIPTFPCWMGLKFPIKKGI